MMPQMFALPHRPRACGCGQSGGSARHELSALRQHFQALTQDLAERDEQLRRSTNAHRDTLRKYDGTKQTIGNLEDDLEQLGRKLQKARNDIRWHEEKFAGRRFGHGVRRNGNGRGFHGDRSGGYVSDERFFW